MRQEAYGTTGKDNVKSPAEDTATLDLLLREVLLKTVGRCWTLFRLVDLVSRKVIDVVFLCCYPMMMLVTIPYINRT